MRSNRRFFAAIAALAAMLFAQAAFALAVCNPQGMPSRAQALVEADQHAPCHEPAENANLCLAHCQNAEQTLDKHQVKLPDLSAVPVLQVRGARHMVSRRTWAPSVLSPVVGPPPRILFRTLLI